jgi:triphosphoribosyl-dephospho-CoA synthase
MPLPVRTPPRAGEIADLAVAALHDEVDLTPKPGLVDRRGSGAHTDMTPALLHTSAEALRPVLRECCTAAEQLPVGPELRARLGVIGRGGERTMLTATGGVNTHRGALWALGLLAAALGTGATGIDDVLATAGELARLPDPAAESRSETTHGARAARRHGAEGARGQAQSGFPAVVQYGLPALRVGTPIDALLAVMAHLDDTCLLHRGGADGLAAVQSAARAVIDAGGPATAEGHRRFAALDRLCAARRLSPGGSGDLLAATLFLSTFDDAIDDRSALCRS